MMPNRLSRMTNPVRFLVFTFLYLLPFGTWAQFIFQNLRGQDGLSAKQVRCLFKDSDGYLWIGTANGLNRFDGAVIKQYKKPAGEKDIYLNAIHPLNTRGELLVGTSTGIKIFNKKSGQFSTDKRFESLKNELIVAIRSDAMKRIWIITPSQIFIYSNDKLLPLKKVIPDAAIISNKLLSFSAFEWDSKRYGFWVGGENVYFIDCKYNKVYHKGNNPFHSPLFEATHVYAIALDNQFNVWYGCDANLSLNFWNHQTGKNEKYTDLDGKKITGGCNHLFVDQKNRLWISTWLFASFLKEPGKPVTKIPYAQTQIYSIGYGFFRDVIEDDEGNVWFGTINGVSKSQDQTSLRAIYKLPSYNFFLDTGFSHANSIRIDGDNIIACKEEGILIYNMVNRTSKRYFVTQKQGELIRNRFMMACKQNGTWWFSGEDGIYSLRPGSNSLVKLKVGKAQAGLQYSNFIFTDANDKIWFHIRDEGLYRYDPKTGKTDFFDGKNPASGAFRYTSFQSFVKLHSGDLLFALNDKGLVKFDMTREKFSMLPVKNSAGFIATGMAEDYNGEIWTSVWGKGLVKMNLKAEVTDSVNTANDLITDHIHNIGVDNRGAVWGASREGLFFFTPETRAVTRVETNLGQNLQDYWNNLEMDHGKVYAVMLDHIVVFDPFRFAAVPVKKPPHITSIEVFHKEKTDFQENKMLQFAAGQDDITFHYASFYHRDIPSLKYSYKLEGLNENWVNAGRTLVASFNNIAPGHYVFKVRSTNEYGKWMPEVTSQPLYISPYWWQTWWAVGIYLLILMGILQWSYKSLLLRKQKRVIDKTIDYFANSVYGENSVNEICWDIARNCISQLNFEDCVVYLMENGKLVQKAAYGPKNPKGHEIDDPIELEPGVGIVGAVALSGKPIIIGDTSKDPRYVVDDQRRLSEISVPIMHEGKVIGVIDSEHQRKNFFTEDHVKALSTIASISANKIAEALAEDEAQEKSIQLLEINKMLAESQLMALRAQMNPHFVFNCLNSIQECIVTEKYGEASKYLNKFSKLFRIVLNNSGRNLVTIQEEQEVLDLYMQLEQMRFEKSFTYEILVDDSLEEDEIQIPSMLLQPYVENALWHGLMHSPRKRHLSIQFNRLNDEVLECLIDDNGVGRKKSFELKKQNSKSKRHESKGLQISQDRLDLLQRQGQHAQVSITDKYDGENNSTGTLITIELSTFLKNF